MIDASVEPRLALRTRPTPAAGLASSLGGKVINLGGVNIEHDLTTPGVSVLDRDRSGVSLIELLPCQVTDDDRLSSHEAPLFLMGPC